MQSAPPPGLVVSDLGTLTSHDQVELDRLAAEGVGRRRGAVTRVGLVLVVAGLAVAVVSLAGIVDGLRGGPPTPDPGRAIVAARMVADSTGRRCSSTAAFSVEGRRFLAAEPPDAVGCDAVGERALVDYAVAAPGDGTAVVTDEVLTLSSTTWGGALVGLTMVIVGALRAPSPRRR